MKKDGFKKYFSYESMIANISAVVFPVLFGVILDNYSYMVVFAILSAIAGISFMISFTIKDVQIECQRINLKESIKNIKSKKLFLYSGLQSIIDGLTNGGVIQMLTTLIIFCKFENEAFMGSVSSVIAIICAIVAIFSKKKINKNNFFKIAFPITFILFIITIPISFHTSLVLVIMYKLCIDICDVITSIEGNTVTFECFNDVLDSKYKLDYWWFLELTLATGRALGLIAIIIIALLSHNSVEALTILFIYFTTFYMLRTIVIQKIRKLQQTIKENKYAN